MGEYQSTQETSAITTPEDFNNSCTTHHFPVMTSEIVLNETGNENPPSNIDLTSDKTEAFDELQKKLGGYGRYQIIIYILLGIVYMRGCWHALVPIYEGLDPSYHCNPAPGLTLNQSIPGHMKDGEWEYSSCKQYVNYSMGNETQDCTRGFHYNYDDNHTTAIISEFTLTCDRHYLIELSTTLYMIGATCGVIFLSPLSERFGAKNVMLICLWLQAIVGTALPWSGSIAVFIMLKYFIGVFNMTIALCVAVMMTETFDATHREIPTLGTSYFWSLGIMTLALFAYLMPDWKDLQLAITLPVPIISIAYIWLIPQSLPWLVSKKKLVEAKKVITRFLCINNLQEIPHLDQQLMQFNEKPKDEKESMDKEVQAGDQTPSEHSESESTPSYTILDLFRFAPLRISTIILCYLFLVNSLAYFGIIYHTPLLDGNRFLNLFYSGLVEIPAYTLCVVTHKFFGRRRSICMFLLICGISNIVIPFIPNESGGHDLSNLKLVLAFVGKFGITGSYSALYLYASEIFPTVIRNQGLGFCSFFENIGSIAAPNMVYASEESASLPLMIFGILTLAGGVLTLFLPETHNRPLLHKMEDVENSKHK